MPTLLTKSVKRKLPNTSDGHGRSIVIELVPGATEIIRLREEGRRTYYSVPLKTVYRLAARLHAEAEMKEKKTRKKAKKAEKYHAPKTEWY